MIKVKCYFCQQSTALCPFGNIVTYQCYNCMSNHKLTNMLIGEDTHYINIFVKLFNNTTIYQVILDFIENQTKVYVDSPFNDDLILSIQGHPITPSNIKEKLPTYLTFL